ncbi:MAG: GNAT family N-acetyltransferase [Bacteroidia bacterium]
MIKVDENISLELVNEKHAEAIFDLVNANKLKLREWLPWVDNADLDFIKNFVQESKKHHLANTDLAYVIIFNDKIIGRIGIYSIDNKNKTGSVGYWIDENFEGKGIITRSCKAIINKAFQVLHLNRIEIKCGTENYKSQGIPERLNFKKEGIIRQGEILNNKFIDLYLYSMLRSDWGNTY